MVRVASLLNSGADIATGGRVCYSPTINVNYCVLCDIKKCR